MTWRAPWRRRTRREVAAAALVLAGLTAFAVLVYVAVVLGGGALLGRSSTPDLVLSVVATAVLAVSFDRVQSLLERLAARLVHGGTPTPYEVWERFTGTVTGSYPADELPQRMARVLVEATGAQWAQVWLDVQGRPRLAATWPPDAQADSWRESPGRRALPVRYGDEVLGHLVLREQSPLTVVEERLFAGLADQAGLVLRSARLRAELAQRAEELSLRVEELRASRQRLVDVQDERRRTLERDIHDGAQQHLVALAVNLRLAQTLRSQSPERAAQLVETEQAATAAAIDTLLQLSRGIYPPLLEADGLVAALRSVAASGPLAVDVVAHEVARYDASVEVAAYFVCLEAVQNAAKHAAASTVTVTLSGEPDALTLRVEDGGTGFDAELRSDGSGLANLRDRVEAVGGVLSTTSAPGRGTRVEARIPVQARTAERVG